MFSYITLVLSETYFIMISMIVYLEN